MPSKMRFQCSSCDKIHADELDAEYCCKPEVWEVWQCSVCSKVHEAEAEADRCCGDSGLERCPCCARDYAPNAIGYHAIKVAGHCQTCNPLFTHEQQFLIEAALDDRNAGEYGWPMGDAPSLLRGEVQA